MNILISQKAALDRHGQKIDSLEQGYYRYFDYFGIRLFPVPNFIDGLDEFLTEVDYKGLILSGGGGISPKAERYKVEAELIKKCAALKRPILGICHGMQMLNYYFGGSITKQIHKTSTVRRSAGETHPVKITKRLFGPAGRITVNQYHDDGIKKDQVADDFDIFAVDNDLDIVEGIVHKKLPIVGIQWHPERVRSCRTFDKAVVKKLLNLRGAY